MSSAAINVGCFKGYNELAHCQGQNSSIFIFLLNGGQKSVADDTNFFYEGHPKITDQWVITFLYIDVRI